MPYLGRMWQPGSAKITKIILHVGCLNKCKRHVLLAIQQQVQEGSSFAVEAYISVSLPHKQICTSCVIHRNYKSITMLQGQCKYDFKCQEDKG